MNAQIIEIIRQFSLDNHRPITPRSLNLGVPLEPRAGNIVTVITGVRRCGKTYRLFQEMDALMQTGVSPERILYFNFEDDRLAPVTPRTGDEVIEAFLSLHPHVLDEGIYLFFDEIQEMEGWGTWMRRIVDTTKATIYVTGSSSKLLSSEVATEFRGRSIEREMGTLSFTEYVRFNNLLPAGDVSALSLQDRLALERALGTYLERGGFPAVQAQTPLDAALTLQGYAQQVVARDVVERYGYKNLRGAMMVVRRVLATNAKQLSIRKIGGDLRAQGVTLSRDVLASLIDHFEEAFLVSRVREFSFALADKTTSQPKLYACDPGLAAANAPASSVDAGQRLENVVYLELCRRGGSTRLGSVFSFRTREHGYEVDFIVGDPLFGEAYQLYQVTQELDDPSTFKRETRALWEAMDECGLDESVIVVKEGTERKLEQGGKRIHCIPAWRWLADKGV